MALTDWVPQIRGALNQALTDHIKVTQSKLAQQSPKDTGRLASSWFIGKNQPDLKVREEPWGTPSKRTYPGGKGTEGVITKKGTMKVETEEYSGKITIDGDWYISNNLTYAQRCAFDPVYAKGAPGGANWFTAISTQQSHDLRKRIKKQMGYIK